MGRVGRAAVKALYARQHATDGDHRVDKMLKAALWALVDIVLKAPARLTRRSLVTSVRPLVYADAYIKVGEEGWHLGERTEFIERWHEAEIPKEQLENGFGIAVIAPGSKPI